MKPEVIKFISLVYIYADKLVQNTPVSRGLKKALKRAKSAYEFYPQIYMAIAI